jgi:hypothetical protein
VLIKQVPTVEKKSTYERIKLYHKHSVTIVEQNPINLHYLEYLFVAYSV